jgi:hypothetical protein
MFAFNSADPAAIDAALAASPVTALRAKANLVWTLLLD